MSPDEICPHNIRVIDCKEDECDELLTECEHGVSFGDPDECSMCELEWKEIMHDLCTSCSPSGDFEEGLENLRRMFDEMRGQSGT